MKRSLIFMFVICITIFAGCSSNAPEEIIVENNTGSVKDGANTTTVLKADENGVFTLKFKNTNTNEVINALNGKQVSMTGYLSTLSPLNGEFAYLMNMPYQSCPFCIPGTSAISNTLTIVARDNSTIEFTDQPVTAVGTLEVGEFTDEFGYEYGVRLNNVTVTKANVDELSTAIKQYNLLAENGVVGNIYNSIMTVDEAVFYEYYGLEKPETIFYDSINATKSQLKEYNSNGDYDKLVILMDDLINLSETVNSDISNEDYSNFAEYQDKLQNLYYVFADWMAEGEL